MKMKTSNKIILTTAAIPVVIVVLMLLILRIMLPNNVSNSKSEVSSKRFNQSFTVNPGGTLLLETDIGSIRIIGVSGNSVSVTADIQGQEKDVNQFEISAGQQGNDVVITGKDAKQGLGSGRWFSKFQVTYTIQVPRQYSLNLRTAGGDVDIDEIEGRISGRTFGGTVGLRGIKGDVEFATSGGDINIEASSGKISMETSGGNINAGELAGELAVKTSGGNIQVGAIEGNIRAGTSGGNVMVRLKGENKGVDAETSGGNITIEAPNNIAANIDAKTFGGEARCDLPVATSGKPEKGSIQGTINGGGPLIHAHTFGGNILITGVE